MELQTPPAATQDAMVGWWPSKYGAGDEAGALNEITAAKVLEAVRLVRQGLVYDLAITTSAVPAVTHSTPTASVAATDPRQPPTRAGRDSPAWRDPATRTLLSW